MSKTLLEKRTIKVQKIEIPKDVAHDKVNAYLKENVETFEFPKTNSERLKIPYLIISKETIGDVDLHLFGEDKEGNVIGYIKYPRSLALSKRDHVFTDFERDSDQPIDVLKIGFGTTADDVLVEFGVDEFEGEEMAVFFDQRTR